MSGERLWDSVDVVGFEGAESLGLDYLEPDQVEERFGKSETDSNIFSYISWYGDNRVVETEDGDHVFEKKLKDPIYTDESGFFEPAMYRALSERGMAPEPVYICRYGDDFFLGTDFMERHGDPQEVDLDEEVFAWNTGHLAGYLEKNSVHHGDLGRGSSSTNTLASRDELLLIDFTETDFTDSEIELGRQTRDFYQSHREMVGDNADFRKNFFQGYKVAIEDEGLEEEVRGYVEDLEGREIPVNCRP